MSDLKDKVVQQGQAVILREANVKFQLMAAALQTDKNITISVEQSYLSGYDVADDIRKIVKDKTNKPPADIKALLDPNKTITDIVKEGLYNKLKTYLDKLEAADFEPPLPADFTSGARVLVKQFPNKIASDPRRTGRLVKLGPTDVLKSTEVQKWLYNNSMLYGFVLYSDNALYYMGVDFIKSKISGAANKQSQLLLTANTFIKQGVVISQLSLTFQQVLDVQV